MVRVEDISGTLPEGATPLDDISELIPAYITTIAELKQDFETAVGALGERTYHKVMKENNL